jgi:molybdopterin molybdotransferase
MQESVDAGPDHIVVRGNVERGEWVRAEGRDLAMGKMALPRGKRLSAIDLGLIASLGIPEITVSRQVRIGLLATGDELTPVGTPLRPGSIYDSNRLAIRGLLSSPAFQVTDLGCCRDDPAALRAALLEASSWNDALVTIGGASVGDADHVVPVLREIGHVDLWKMAVKPGKPFLYGRIGGCHVFGLPGNPASAMVTCLQMVRPAAARLAGALPEPALRVRALCEQPIAKTTDRLEFQRGIFRAEPDGRLSVRPVEGQDADRLASFSAANCFLVLPADCRGVAAGEPVTIEPFGSSL